MSCPTKEGNKESEIVSQRVMDCDNSIKPSNLWRMYYFSHLIGGLKSVIHSRFFSNRPRPFTFSHMVTSRCNCDCDFCFWKHQKYDDELTLPEIKRIYSEAQKEGYMNSILWGGEPLIREDFTEIAKISHDCGMYTKMATNGWFLEENHEFGNYMDLIFVSIDAIGEKHDKIRGNRVGLFDRAIRGIELLKRLYPKMRIYICCTVSMANDMQSLTEVAKLCKDLDILLYFTVNKSNQNYQEWEGKNKFKELEYEENKLAEIFKGIKALRKAGYPIRNSEYFMDYIINKKNYYECHWPKIATVMYPNGDLLRCYDRKPFLNVRNKPLADVIKSPEFIETVNACKDCKLACVGNYALDASGLWKFDLPAIKSIAHIAIT